MISRLSAGVARCCPINLSAIKQNVKSQRAALMLLAISSLLLGCSSSAEPKTTSYYLLNTQASLLPSDGVNAANQLSAADKAQVRPKVVVAVSLAKYLAEPYLVMQIDDHKIHYASFHMWAEPLIDSTRKALLSDLNGLSTSGDKGYDFVVQTRTNTKVNANAQAPTPVLKVQIDYFHVTNQSTVVLSGRYQYLQGDDELDQMFAFEAKVPADGYSPSVAVMRQLVNQLAAQITASI
ncbi:MAG: PqiC family protein [Shewanella sp.]